MEYGLREGGGDWVKERKWECMGIFKKYLSDRKLKEISLNSYIYSFKVEDKVETSWTGHKKNDVSDTFYSPHHTFRNLSHLLLFCPSVQLEADEAKLENWALI